jgi:hypothetical protein
MLKGDKYFELMKIAKPPEVMLAYRNRNFSLTYPTRLANKSFTLPLTFNSASMFFNLGALLDVFLDRRSHNNVLMIFNIRSLFQLNRNNVAY